MDIGHQGRDGKRNVSVTNIPETDDTRWKVISTDPKFYFFKDKENRNFTLMLK